jgi:hypothetical protein
MKFFIPSFNRPDKHTTAKLPAIDSFDWRIILHNDAERDRYQAANPTIEPDRYIVTGHPAGLHGKSAQLNAAIDALAADEWAMFADDDLKYLVTVPASIRHLDDIPLERVQAEKLRINERIGFDTLHAIITDTLIPKAEAIGARMIGFGVNSNLFFHTKHFSTVGNVAGRLFLVKGPRLRFDTRLHMEDFAYSLAHLVAYGAILIDRWTIGEAVPFADDGGFGRGEARMLARASDILHMTQTYPGLVTPYMNSENVPSLKLKANTPEKLAAWRANWKLRQGR